MPLKQSSQTNQKMQMMIEHLLSETHKNKNDSQTTNLNNILKLEFSFDFGW